MIERDAAPPEAGRPQSSEVLAAGLEGYYRDKLERFRQGLPATAETAQALRTCFLVLDKSGFSEAEMEKFFNAGERTGFLAGLRRIAEEAYQVDEDLRDSVAFWLDSKSS